MTRSVLALCESYPSRTLLTHSWCTARAVNRPGLLASKRSSPGALICGQGSNIHCRIATYLRDIKRRVIEVRERREVYKIDGAGARPDAVDPRLLAHYTKVTELVGIDDARDDLIKVLTDGSEASKQHGRVISIVGCGGLGKTTLANVVYLKIRAQFDCWAFVSVSQTPDMRRLFRGILSGLGKYINEETLDVKHFIDAIRKFLQAKTYE